ncbi:MAG: hypothetical protein ACKPKO_64755, partial [Candidatus Fonsibacter sp.]
TKRQALADINETLEDVIVFLYGPAIESGVDITVKVNKRLCYAQLQEQLAACVPPDDQPMQMRGGPKHGLLERRGAQY